MTQRLPAQTYRGPDWLDRVIAAGTALLLLVLVAAVWRGQAQWGQVPGAVWLHLATIAITLALTPVLLLRRRGDGRHRWLGYAWVAAMAVTAFDSLAIRTINPGHFSPIHLLSALTIVTLPLIVWTARSGRHARHRRTVRILCISGLLVAGYLTLPFGRMLGAWLLGS